MSESDKMSEEEYKRSWIEAELEETLDDLFEAEFNQPILTDELRKIYKSKHPDMLDRRTYYSNLLRLQSELVKLQDWVEHTKSKVLIICEGRDSAGKGGVIKRITQRMNPRVARVVALPAPTEREQSQWSLSARPSTPRRPRPVDNWPDAMACLYARVTLPHPTLSMSNRAMKARCPCGAPLPPRPTSSCTRRGGWRAD